MRPTQIREKKMGLFDFFKPALKSNNQEKACVMTSTLNAMNPKERFIEFDVKWSLERLHPYFDVAISTLEMSKKCWWSCRTIYELLVLKSDDFRQRINKLAIDEESKKLIADFLLDGLRTRNFSTKLRKKIEDSISFLYGYNAAKECKDALNQFKDWDKVVDLLEDFQKSTDPDELNMIERKLKGLCSNFNNSIAVKEIVDNVINLAINLNNKGGMFMKTVNLKSGKEKTRVNPTPIDAQNLGVTMLASMDKELLRYCRNDSDYTLEPGYDRKNYNLLLDDALKI